MEILFFFFVFLIMVILLIFTLKKQNKNNLQHQLVETSKQSLDFEIAGMYYRPPHVHKIAKNLAVGTNLSLELDSKNEFDQFAVKIMYKDIHLGYIPATYSLSVFSALQKGIPSSAEIIRNDFSRIPHIWVKIYIDDTKKNVQQKISEPCNTDKDILDGVDIDYCIRYIARLLIYSEYGYEYKDENFSNLEEMDPLFEEAARLLVVHQQGSTSLIQRKFSIGYNRAGRIMDQLEKIGIVGQAIGSSPREILILDECELEQKISSVEDYIPNDQIIDAIEERYYEKIQERKISILNRIKQEQELAKLKQIELEKATIRNKLLEKERKKQLEQEVRKELIDKGLISIDKKKDR